jgi:hypothetical protein
MTMLTYPTTASTSSATRLMEGCDELRNEGSLPRQSSKYLRYETA